MALSIRSPPVKAMRLACCAEIGKRSRSASVLRRTNLPGTAAGARWKAGFAAGLTADGSVRRTGAACGRNNVGCAGARESSQKRRREDGHGRKCGKRRNCGVLEGLVGCVDGVCERHERRADRKLTGLRGQVRVAAQDFFEARQEKAARAVFKAQPEAFLFAFDHRAAKYRFEFTGDIYGEPRSRDGRFRRIDSGGAVVLAQRLRFLFELQGRFGLRLRGNVFEKCRNAASGIRGREVRAKGGELHAVAGEVGFVRPLFVKGPRGNGGIENGGRNENRLVNGLFHHERRPEKEVRSERKGKARDDKPPDAKLRSGKRHGVKAAGRR